MKQLFILALFTFYSVSGITQINAKLFRYVDVSQEHICFVYGGDIWIVAKDGGAATQLTNSPGEESYPKFSPDGKMIGYTAMYRGNPDVYTIPISGGLPHRVTYQSHADRMLDWHPDGKTILFASRRMLGQRSSNQFFTVAIEGGLPELLPLPYGELASYAPDGSKIAYITKITENYPFKRYRGGLASDVMIYDIKKKSVEKITDNDAIDGKPSWSGNTIYFLSDRDEEMRLNIWAYNTGNKKTEKLTNITDFDISMMNAGPSDIVYEAGGNLYKMDLKTRSVKEINVTIVSDLTAEMPRTESVANRISNVTAGPGGNRVVFEARGELFNAPKKEGYTTNITQSSGAFDRAPSWSPDGKYIAYWSDKSGENEIYLQESNTNASARKLSNRNGGYGYTLYWSPNSKHIAFIDEKNQITLIDVTSGEETIADRLLWHVTHPAKNFFKINWSHDSNWLTYSKNLENTNEAIFVYDVKNKKVHQVTSGFYNESGPAFSTDGKHLFFTSKRNLSAEYSDLEDGTWIYPNASHLVAVTLQKDTPSLMPVKNDEVKVKEEAKEETKEDKTEAQPKEEDEGQKADTLNKDEEASIVIDFEDIESRIRVLSPEAGNLGNILTFDGKLVYTRYPNSGSGGRSASLQLLDLKKMEEKTIIDNIDGADYTADRKAIITSQRRKFGIIEPAPGQKIEEPIPTDGLSMELIPREEWRQLFNDAWRRHRDFFYDPNMHGLDWNEMKVRYGALIEDARTRWDVNFIISNLVSELSAGHTYTRGGDTENVSNESTGYLGIDWKIKDGKYQIGRIVRPASWDTEVRSPFDEPGSMVKEGHFIHSVNGQMLDIKKDPYAGFMGLDNKTVSLMISEDGNVANAKEIIVKCLSQNDESHLRYLEWIENNRKMVDKLSNGKLGYVYMSNTSGRGQLELVKMFYGQLDKEGFVIDERFNGGGQLADRFLELLKRPVVYNLSWRHGKDHIYPTKTNTGPVGMLINGWAGSGGDGLPWAFQELKAGPIVGERTLGILVGPATGHTLIDGGGITVPGARLYDNDGHWFWEGEGVSPDIEVWDDPNILMQGRDPQVERLVSELMKMVETQPKMATPAPPLEDRTAKGFLEKNK